MIDLFKLGIDELKNEIQVTKYNAIEIDSLKSFNEQALQQMLSSNGTRHQFSQRFRDIIDRYNAGESENEVHYQQLLKLIKSESRRQARGGRRSDREELELFDLLVTGKTPTKAKELKVKHSAKKPVLKADVGIIKERMVLDWYRDVQPRARVKTAIEKSLVTDPPMSCDKETFAAKTELLLSHFIDMAVQGYGWVAP